MSRTEKFIVFGSVSGFCLLIVGAAVIVAWGSPAGLSGFPLISSKKKEFRDADDVVRHLKDEGMHFSVVPVSSSWLTLSFANERGVHLKEYSHRNDAEDAKVALIKKDDEDAAEDEKHRLRNPHIPDDMRRKHNRIYLHQWDRFIVHGNPDLVSQIRAILDR